MASGKFSTPFRQGETIEVAREQWNVFLAEFTRENRGAHARLDVYGPDATSPVETEDRPLDGVTADVKDRESSVWITFGSTPEDHFAHGVHNVTAIRVLPRVGDRGPALQVESQSGNSTLLQLSNPEEYALPPVTGGQP